MAISDSLADALTKLRNASNAGHKTVDVRRSGLTENVLKVLKQEGFIETYKPLEETVGAQFCRIYLKYFKKRPAITQLKRISTPGKREYRKAKELPRVLSGLGTAIVSTSSGVMTEQSAFRQHIGGEIVCYVW